MRGREVLEPGVSEVLEGVPLRPVVVAYPYLMRFDAVTVQTFGESAGVEGFAVEVAPGCGLVFVEKIAKFLRPQPFNVGGLEHGANISE